jgi:hypothetical protein
MALGSIEVITRNGVKYATHYISYRIKNVGPRNKTIYLGKVVDLEKGIFHSRKRGLFKYSKENGFMDYNDENSPKENINTLIDYELAFGDVWLITEVMKRTGYLSLLKDLMGDDSDTLIALALFKLLERDYANKYADIWVKFSYAQIIYPKCKLKSQRLSEFLKRAGEDVVWSKYFNLYNQFILKNYSLFTKNKELKDKKNQKPNKNNTSINPVLSELNIDESNYCDSEIDYNITFEDFDNNSSNINNDKPFCASIDSTGLPNSINIPITSINNHNGKISNEIRLIYVVDKNTGFPLYFRYIPGNIVDVTTLKATLAELAGFNIQINQVIVDAGYYSDENIKELYLLNIPFVIRLVSNRKLYKNLVMEHLDDLIHPKYMIVYRNRLLYCKKVKVNLLENTAYAYIMVDYDKKNSEGKRYAVNAINEYETIENIYNSMKKHGLFILLSKNDIKRTDILPLYYTRQEIEQIFDILKTQIHTDTIRSHTEEVFRGHLFISTIASTLYIMLNNLLYGSKFIALEALYLFRRLNIRILKDNKYVIHEPIKQMNDIIKFLNFDIPFKEGALDPAFPSL